LSDITEYKFKNNTARAILEINCTVDKTDIQIVLNKTKPDKYPGIDRIPNRFFKAIGNLLITAIVILVNQYWRAEYYLKSFQRACTIVLQKPDKDDYSEPGI
jgi:hypothetical protein